MHGQIDRFEGDAQRLLKLLSTAATGKVDSRLQTSLDHHLLVDFVELTVDLDELRYAQLCVEDSQTTPSAGEVLGEAFVRDGGQFHDEPRHDDSPFKHLSLDTRAASKCDHYSGGSKHCQAIGCFGLSPGILQPSGIPKPLLA